MSIAIFNVLGINEGGMVNGAMSRKVEITLNSAVSLVQTLQPLLFIPCYKSGGGWSGKCSETGEVTISLCGIKNSNHRHLLITLERLAMCHFNGLRFNTRTILWHIAKRLL